ncbi:MAG: hypothetical protein ACFFB3_12780 [Candidatus Hodarchaeota archaeon]
MGYHLADDNFEQKISLIEEKEGPEGVFRFCEHAISQLPKEISQTHVLLKFHRLAALLSLKKFDIPNSEFENIIENIESVELDPREKALWKGRIFNFWGVSLGSRGFFARAVEKYQLSHDQITGFEPQWTATLNNIGLNLMYLGRWEAAHEIFLDGLKNSAPDDLSARAYLLTNLGELLRRWEKDEALKVLQEAITLNEKLKDQEGVAEASHSLIRFFLDHKQPQKAQPVFIKLRSIEPGPLEQFCRLFQLRSEALWALAHQQTEEAIKHYNIALELAMEIPANEQVMAIQYDLALVFLQEAIRGHPDALDQLQSLLTQIAHFAEENNLRFIVAEILMIQAKCQLWMREVIPAHELIERIRILLEQFPYEHLQERFSELKDEYEALSSKSGVEYEGLINPKMLVEYFQKYSKRV